MKTLGLIGGMSWESTVPYYCLINEDVKQRLGCLHSGAHRVLGTRGVHTRTSVGVLQLPKGAAVELDLIATRLPIAHRR